MDLLTTEVLAAAARRSGFDLIITGNQSSDGAAGVIPAMLAEVLGVAQATNLNAVEITETTVSGERAVDSGTMQVVASLPAVISITERLPEGRFPTFKDITAAKKKAIETVSLTELGVDPDDPSVSRSIMIAVSERAARAAGVKIVDHGDAGQQLADFLVQNRLV